MRAIAVAQIGKVQVDRGARLRTATSGLPSRPGHGPQPRRNGFAIRSWPWMTMPSCLSSDQSVSQSASSAETAIIASWIGRLYGRFLWYREVTGG